MRVEGSGRGRRLFRASGSVRGGVFPKESVGLFSSCGAATGQGLSGKAIVCGLTGRTKRGDGSDERLENRIFGRFVQLALMARRARVIGLIVCPKRFAWSAGAENSLIRNSGRVRIGRHGRPVAICRLHGAASFCGQNQRGLAGEGR